MIKIFDETDTSFSSNGNIVIDPIKCIEVRKKSLNGWYIDCEIDIKYKNYISNGKLVVIKSKSKLNPQAFRINNGFIEKDNIISFQAVHVMFDAENYHLLDVRPENKNGLAAIEYINERTDTTSPFSVYSDVSTVATAYFIRKSLLEAWEIMEEKWGGYFDADNWNISFVSSISVDNGATLNYGDNIQGLQIYEDWSEVVTKICPVGFDGLLLPEKYLSADIQYPTPYTRTVSFDTDLEQDEQTEANLITELRANAQKYLNENKYPKVSYEVFSNINQNMSMGEKVHVKHPLVTILTEVIEYEYNTNTKRIEKMTFGNFVRDVQNKFNEYKDSVDKVEQHSTKQDSVIAKQTELINNLGKEGYIYWDENELLVMDAESKADATNLWRFNLGGIGFSSNGYEGPFEIAMTMDGQINANMITIGKLNVARIEGLNEYKKDNLLINSNFSADSSVAKGWTDVGSNGNGFSRELVRSNNKTWLHLASTNTSIRWYGLSQYGINGKFKSNTKYTVSFLAYGFGNVRIGIHENLTGSGIIEQYWKSIEVSNEIKRYDYTFTTTSSNIDNFYFMVYGQDYGLYDFYITEIKFEEGEYATSWNDNLADHIASSINLNPDGVLINADKINLTATDIIDIIAGNTINLTSKNIVISSTNFTVTSNGILTSKSGIFEDVTIKSSSTAGNIEISNGCIVANGPLGQPTFDILNNSFGIYTATTGEAIGSLVGTDSKAIMLNALSGAKISLTYRTAARLIADSSGVHVYQGLNMHSYSITNINEIDASLTTSIIVKTQELMGNLSVGGFSAIEVNSPFYYSNAGGNYLGYPVCGCNLTTSDVHKYMLYWNGANLHFFVENVDVGNISDKRLKDDIKAVDERIVNAIGDCQIYQYKAKNRGGLISIGIMAQDFLKNCQKYGIKDPLEHEIISENRFKIDEEELYYSINYEQLLLYRLLALEKRIEDLEKN